MSERLIDEDLTPGERWVEVDPYGEPGGFDDSWRTDPAKLGEVQSELLTAADIGERMMELTGELQELARLLPEDLVLRRSTIKSSIFSLGRDLEQSFGDMRERAHNPTYLGNMAASRHFKAARAEERKRQAERARDDNTEKDDGVTTYINYPHQEGLSGPVEEALGTELRTFEEKLSELLESHPGEHVLIHQQEVGGFFPTQAEGVTAGYQKYGNVPFLVQQILEEQPTIAFPVQGR